MARPDGIILLYLLSKLLLTFNDSGISCATQLIVVMINFFVTDLRTRRTNDSLKIDTNALSLTVVNK